MNIIYNPENIVELIVRLKRNYPQLTDSDLSVAQGNENEMLRVVAYKLGKTKQEMQEIVEKL